MLSQSGSVVPFIQRASRKFVISPGASQVNPPEESEVPAYQAPLPAPPPQHQAKTTHPSSVIQVAELVALNVVKEV